MQQLTPAALRGLLIGLALVVLSLPGLFVLHGALGLGSPPLPGLVLLGATVMFSLALAGGAGAVIGRTNGNGILAALAGLAIGVTMCFVVAPFYAGLVVDGLQRDATGLVWGERDRITDAAQNAVQNGAVGTAKGALDAARAGKLRQEIARLQAQAKSATTPQARQAAADAAQNLAKQLAPKGIAVLKSGAARLSAFGLLLWAVLASPIGAALECRRARR